MTFDEKLDALRANKPLRADGWRAYIDKRRFQPLRMVRLDGSSQDTDMDFFLDWQISEPELIEKTRRQMLGYVANHPVLVNVGNGADWDDSAEWNYDSPGKVYAVMPIDEDGEQNGEVWHVRIVKER